MLEFMVSASFCGIVAAPGVGYWGWELVGFIVAAVSSPTPESVAQPKRKKKHNNVKQ